MASVTGELLAQCGERLVGGEGALSSGGRRTRGATVLGRRGTGLGRVGRLVAATSGLGVGLGERLDLGPVGLPARVCLGVLLLPDLTLRLEALEPLVGLGVEPSGYL